MPPSRAVIGKDGMPNVEYSATFDMPSRVRKILSKKGYSGVSDEETIEAISTWKQTRDYDTEFTLKEVAQQVANLILELYKAVYPLM